MAGKYTNTLQAAILYEQACLVDPAAALRGFAEAMARQGVPFNLVQEGPDFGFLMGPGELHVTATRHQRPADHAVFGGALRSPVTQVLGADAASRVSDHRSHILIELHHGVLGGVADKPEVSSFLEQVGMRKPGHSLEEFNRRVSALGDLCRHIVSLQPASLIHWTQSNLLFPPDRLGALVGQGSPGMLTVHPSLYGEEALPGCEEIPAGLYTIGAADYVGRELHVKPAPIPWMELYNAALVFVRVAIQPNGYIIPNGDTFGHEDGGFSYRVDHLDGKEQRTATGRPLYELTLLFHDKYGYRSPEFRSRELVGDAAAATAMLDPTDARSQEIAQDWADGARMADAAGARFEVYRLKDDGPAPEPPAPRPSSPPPGRPTVPFGRRGTPFGRRQ